MMASPLLLSVPNVSEGGDRDRIEAIGEPTSPAAFLGAEGSSFLSSYPDGHLKRNDFSSKLWECTHRRASKLVRPEGGSLTGR